MTERRRGRARDQGARTPGDRARPRRQEEIAPIRAAAESVIGTARGASAYCRVVPRTGDVRPRDG